MISISPIYFYFLSTSIVEAKGTMVAALSSDGTCLLIRHNFSTCSVVCRQRYLLLYVAKYNFKGLGLDSYHPAVYRHRYHGPPEGPPGTRGHLVSLLLMVEFWPTRYATLTK